jgi:hypothetical protein
VTHDPMKTMPPSSLGFRRRFEQIYARIQHSPGLSAALARRLLQYGGHLQRLVQLVCHFLTHTDDRRPMTRTDFSFPVDEIGFGGLTGTAGAVTRLMRRTAIFASAVVKQHELKQIERVNLQMRLDRPVDQQIMRNLIAWQLYLRTSLPEVVPPVRAHLILQLGAEDDSRIADLLALVFMSRNIGNVVTSFIRTEGGATTLVDDLMRRHLTPEDAFDLGVLPDGALLRKLDREGCSGAIQPLIGSRKKIHDYVKLVAPGRYSVAVSLRETVDGSIDDPELEIWLPVLERLSQIHPVTFCLLNRVPERAADTWPGFLRPLQSLGFSFIEALGAAQFADFYLGVLDVFGLAALGERRPGVYMTLDSDGRAMQPEESPDRDSGLWHVAGTTSPARVADIFASMISANIGR